MSFNIKKTLFSIVSAAVICLTMPVTVLAEQEHGRFRYDEEGNFIHSGGVNKYCGVEYNSSEEETDKLNTVLKINDYVCIYGSNCEITDDEFDKYFKDSSYSFGFTQYCKDAIFNNTFYNVYVYRPSYEDYKNGVDNNSVMDYTLMELRTSAVLVDTSYWYSLSKVGKVLTEVNDNIPVWWDTGYLLINSPIDVKITALHVSESAYNEFYVVANEPYLVKLKVGGYTITAVNGVELSAQDQFLPFSNNIQIETKNTTEQPYELNLEQLIEGDNIPAINMEELKKDDSEAEMKSINVYADLVKEKTKVKDKEISSANKWKIIFVSLIVIAVAGFMITIEILKRKNNRG